MSFPKYPKYRSGGAAGRESPAHWVVAPLKRLVRIENGADYKHVQAAEGYPVIGSGGAFAYACEYMYDGDSVLFGRKGTIDKPLMVSGKFWTIDTMYWTRMLECHDARFVYYLACTIPFAMLSTDTALPSMTKEALYSYEVAVPSRAEELAIAAFLDREVAKIDALIAEQERLIELLKEKRQAVISQAVTKGLNPDARTKPSGIEWIGDIPIHWNVGGLTRFIEPIVDYRGRTPTKQDQGIFLVTARNIRQGRIDYSISQEYVDPESAASLLNRGKPAIGDLLFTTEAPLGQVALVDRTDIAIAQRIVKFRGMPDVMDNRFLMYWIMSDQCQARLTTLATGSTALGIKASKLGMIGCPVPPFFEQAEIVTHCDKEVERCEKLILESESTIALLAERRSALISAAVTGQIDVRGLAEQKAA